MLKRKYEVTFVTGFRMTVSLSQTELKDTIHRYKVVGYQIIEEVK